MTLRGRQAGMVAGSPSYIAPEIWRAQPFDHRIDGYSLLFGDSIHYVNPKYVFDDIFLDCDGGDLRGRSPQSRIDHLEAPLHEGAAHHLGAHVVAIQSELPDEHAFRHPVISLAMMSFRISDVPPPISVNRTSRRWRSTGYSSAYP